MNTETDTSDFKNTAIQQVLEKSIETELGVELIRRSLHPSLFFLRNRPPTILRVSYGSAAKFVYEALAALFIPTIIVLLYALVTIYLEGMTFRNSVMIIGSIVSVPLGFRLGTNKLESLADDAEIETDVSTIRRSFLLVAVPGMVPYFFGAILVFYLGVLTLATNRTLYQLIESGLLILLGLWIMKRIRVLQEFYFSAIISEDQNAQAPESLNSDSNIFT